MSSSFTSTRADARGLALVRISGQVAQAAARMTKPERAELGAKIREIERYPQCGHLTRLSVAEPGDRIARVAMWELIYRVDAQGEILLRSLSKICIF